MFNRSKLSKFIFLAIPGLAAVSVTNVAAEVIIHTDESYLAPIKTGSAKDIITIDNSYMAELNDGAPAVYIDTGDGDDTLIMKNIKDGFAPDNAIYNMGNGNDAVMVGSISTDDGSNESSLDGAVFNGDAGNDLLMLSDTGNIVYNFTLNGGADDDTLLLNNVPGSRLAQLIGGSGDDTIILNNSTCSHGCYIDGDDAPHGVFGGQNHLVINESTVVIGQAETLLDDNGNEIGKVSGGIHNFSKVDVTNNSSLTIGADSDNSYLNDGGTDAQFPGGVSNIDEIAVSNNSSLTLAGSIAGSLADTRINVSSDSQFNIDGAIGADNKLTMNISSLGADGSGGGITYAAEDKDAINVAFSNGEKTVSARSGAWNYAAAIVATEDSASQYKSAQDTVTVSVTQKITGLANDVQGAIAGLDAARQSNGVVAGDIAAHMDTMNNASLLYGVREGVNVWSNFLYQNGDYQGNMDYKSVLQGTQVGMDWTTKLGHDDSLTGGVALAWIRNKASHGDGAGYFNNNIYGNYYSLYAGWQQGLRESVWGLFADGSFSYGDMRYSMGGNNISSQTDGSQQSYSGAYTGDAYHFASRVGVNVALPSRTLFQTYALLGWNKSSAESFNASGIEYANNSLSAWHTGAGMRISGGMTVANIDIMPWADARYQVEFANNTDFTAANYRMNKGHNQHLGLFGLGVSAGSKQDLTFNLGSWYGTGDVASDITIQAGLKYNF